MVNTFFVSRKTNSAFTLVELMAVIGVMALLAVVGVPALKGLGGSGGRKQALGQLIGVFELARNTAIANGTNAGVIFPAADFTNSAYAFRTMAVVACAISSTNGSYEMVGDWISLPKGVVFFPNSLATTNMLSLTNVTYRMLATKITNGSFSAVVFRGDGGLFEGTVPGAAMATNGVAFCEGTIEGGNLKKTTIQPKFERVRLARYTGRVLPTLAEEP
jgi:prepilin-type N-terminal cleavage/methylation domain-containing protein